MSAADRAAVAYLDTSAYVKLVLEEPEAPALARELGRWPARVSSALLVVEATRACARYGRRYAERADAGLETISLLPLDPPLLRSAAALRPSALRSLDALHLATAISLGDRLGALFCYDARLGEAATAAGLAVASPS